MEYLQPVYSCSAIAVGLLCLILFAATVKKRSWLLGYISLIIFIMTLDKATSIWSLNAIIADGIVYKDPVVIRLFVKEALYSFAFASFFVYLLSDYMPAKIRSTVKVFLKRLSDNAEKW